MPVGRSVGALKLILEFLDLDHGRLVFFAEPVYDDKMFLAGSLKVPRLGFLLLYLLLESLPHHLKLLLTLYDLLGKLLLLSLPPLPLLLDLQKLLPEPCRGHTPGLAPAPVHAAVDGPPVPGGVPRLELLPDLLLHIRLRLAELRRQPLREALLHLPLELGVDVPPLLLSRARRPRLVGGRFELVFQNPDLRQERLLFAC
mmetsp:Transcript_5135/g.11007  ORF Transcript_5135/g.11007 Transcript_5135/m.11007 type:complete len:200 (-) Transcript_5135:776-1375(-)